MEVFEKMQEECKIQVLFTKRVKKENGNWSTQKIAKMLTIPIKEEQANFIREKTILFYKNLELENGTP